MAVVVVARRIVTVDTRSELRIANVRDGGDEMEEQRNMVAAIPKSLC